MAQAGAPAALRPQLLTAVASAAQSAAAHGREDLTARLAMTARRLKDPSVRVLVVGEYKHGKSALVNAIVGAPVCPVDDDVATSVPTEVRFSKEPVAALFSEPGGDEEPRRESVPVARVAELVTERGNPANGLRLRSVEVGLPRKLLE